MNISVIAVFAVAEAGRSRRSECTASRDLSVHGNSLRAGAGADAGQASGGAGDGDGVCECLLIAAGLFADPVTRGAGWKLLPGLSAAASRRIPPHLPAGAGRGGHLFLLFLAGRCDRGVGGAADSGAIPAAACGSNLSTKDAAGHAAPFGYGCTHCRRQWQSAGFSTSWWNGVNFQREILGAGVVIALGAGCVRGAGRTAAWQYQSSVTPFAYLDSLISGPCSWLPRFY